MMFRISCTKFTNNERVYDLVRSELLELFRTLKSRYILRLPLYNSKSRLMAGLVEGE